MNKEQKIVSFKDLYTFDLERFEFKRLFTLESPNPRDSHSLVKIGDLLILFGGKSSPENLILRELWTIDCRFAVWSNKGSDITGCIWE